MNYYDWGLALLNEPVASLHLPSVVTDLIGVQQDSVWHPEGDAFAHTCLVVEAMKDVLSRKGIRGKLCPVYLLTALLHDIGKAQTTEFRDGKWRSYGHDVASVPLARDFLQSIGTPTKEGEVILALVRHHMAHCRPGFTRKAVHKLAHGLFPANIDQLLVVMEADCGGRGSASSGLPNAVLNELVPIAQAEGCMFGPPLD